MDMANEEISCNSCVLYYLSASGKYHGLKCSAGGAGLMHVFAAHGGMNIFSMEGLNSCRLLVVVGRKGVEMSQHLSVKAPPRPPIEAGF